MIAGGAEAFAGGEIEDGLQKIRLSLRVFADNEIHTGVQLDAGRLVAPKIVELQALQLHACSSVTRQVLCRNVTASPGRSFLPRIVQTSPLTRTSPS